MIAGQGSSQLHAVDIQEVGQAAIRQFHGDDQAAGGGPDLAHADQAGVRQVTDQLQRTHLHAGLVAHTREELERDGLARDDVRGRPDHAHTALAHAPFKAVAAGEDLTFRKIA